MYKYYKNMDPIYSVYMKDNLDLIKKAIQQKYNNVMIYKSLLNLLSNREEVNLVADILTDEKEHVESFKWLYVDMAKKSYSPEAEPFTSCFDLIKVLKKCIYTEIDSISIYNKIFHHSHELKYKNILSKVINDELRHLGTLNFLYTEHSTKGGNSKYSV